MRTWLEEQSVQPRYSQRFGGVDHGTTGTVLAEIRHGNNVHRRLVWFKGYEHAACGIRGFGQEYKPAHLCVIDGNGYHVANIFDAGRLSAKRIHDQSAAINAALGMNIADQIKIGQTLVGIDE